MPNCNNNRRDFNALKAHISGGEFSLAQQILGLTDGNKRNDPEHHQPCPIPGCPSDDDGFYHREGNGTFQCRHCRCGWDLIALVAAVLRISQTAAYDIVAAASGYESQHPPTNGTLHKLEHRTTYAIVTSDISVPGADLLLKPVSFYRRCEAKTPGGTITLGEFFDCCRDGTYKAQIDKIRAEEDKKKRDALKAELLPCITPHCNPSEGKTKDACERAGRNGIAFLDWDNLPEGEMESAKAKILEHPSVIGICKSASWRGFFAPVAYEGNPDWDVLLTAFQLDFPDYKIDMNSDGIYRLRFASYDPTLILKSGEVFPAILTEQTVPVPSTPSKIVLLGADGRYNTANEPLYHWQPFPLEALPWTLGDFVKDVSASIGIDMSHTALCALVVLSGVIGRTFVIEIKPGYREFAMLWGLSLAKSGGGKSAALNFATRPLRKLQVEALKAFKKEYAAYKAQYKSASAQQSHSGSVVPTEPIRLRYIATNPTTEALLPILAENPFGISLVRDELSGFIKGMDRYTSGGKGDLQVYLEAHGGIPISVDRKTGERFLAADTPSLAIVGGVQTDVLRGSVKSDSELLTTGFLARFLMAFPPSEPIYWNDNVVDPVVQSSYEALIDQILSYRDYMTPDNPGVVRQTPEASALIKDFQHQQADKTLSTSNTSIINVRDKAGMHCARLALVLHVVKHAAIGNFVPSYEDVSEDTMRSAITLAEWFLNEACRVYSMFEGAGASEDRVYMSVKAFIRKQGGRTSLRDLQIGIYFFHGKKVEEVRNRLQEMVDAGLLSIQTVTAKNGHEVELYALSVPSTTSTVPEGIIRSTGLGDGIDASGDEGSENSVDVYL